MFHAKAIGDLSWDEKNDVPALSPGVLLRELDDSRLIPEVGPHAIRPQGEFIGYLLYSVALVVAEHGLTR